MIVRDATPSPTGGATPLDQSLCLLRHPSHMHLAYLVNMGVRATLTISLLHEGQLWGMLAGDYDQSTAERRALAATRQLAKRQLTWLRHEPGVQAFAMESADLPGAVEAVLRSQGLRDALSASSG